MGYNKRENHPNWKGGKYINKDGYVMILVAPLKYKAEHILVMEKKIGRKLLLGEIVHHIDESFEARSNNDPSNLQLVSRPDHNKHHMIGNTHVKWKGYCISFSNWHGKYRLLIHDKITKKWSGGGSYNTKEEALKAYEKSIGK